MTLASVFQKAAVSALALILLSLLGLIIALGVEEALKERLLAQREEQELTKPPELPKPACLPMDDVQICDTARKDD